jgi:hypothetical protein
VPVYLFEAPIPTDEEPDAVYCFGVVADHPTEAKRIIRLLADAEYIGEQWEPETLAHEVDKRKLN